MHMTMLYYNYIDLLLNTHLDATWMLETHILKYLLLFAEELQC